MILSGMHSTWVETGTQGGTVFSLGRGVYTWNLDTGAVWHIQRGWRLGHRGWYCIQFGQRGSYMPGTWTQVQCGTYTGVKEVLQHESKSLW